MDLQLIIGWILIISAVLMFVYVLSLILSQDKTNVMTTTTVINNITGETKTTTTNNTEIERLWVTIVFTLLGAATLYMWVNILNDTYGYESTWIS